MLPDTRALVEELESRALLSGNVTATVEGNILVVSGDAAANGIAIEHDNSDPDTTFTLRGVNAGGGPTTVNDESGTQIFDGVRGIQIRTRGGADDVSLDDDDMVVRRNLTINLGAGDDSLLLGDEVDGEDEGDDNDITVGRNLTVRGKGGNDIIQLGESTVTGQTLLAGGGGDDDLTVDDNTFPGPVSLVGGGGDDTLTSFTNNNFDTAPTLRGGPGNNTINDDAEFGDIESA